MNFSSENSGPLTTRQSVGFFFARGKKLKMNEIERKYFDSFTSYLKSEPCFTFIHNQLKEYVKIQINETYTSDEAEESIKFPYIIFNGSIFSDSIQESDYYNLPETTFEIRLEVPNYTVSGFLPDFVLTTGSISRVSLKFAIEIDGHEFHEKTKEQASNDRKKDRAYLKNCYIPIRFTGSDVYHDVDSCVKETLETYFQFYIENTELWNKTFKAGANYNG